MSSLNSRWAVFGHSPYPAQSKENILFTLVYNQNTDLGKNVSSTTYGPLQHQGSWKRMTLNITLYFGVLKADGLEKQTRFPTEKRWVYMIRLSHLCCEVQARPAPWNAMKVTGDEEREWRTGYQRTSSTHTSSRDVKPDISFLMCAAEEVLVLNLTDCYLLYSLKKSKCVRESIYQKCSMMTCGEYSRRKILMSEIAGSPHV